MHGQKSARERAVYIKPLGKNYFNVHEVNQSSVAEEKEESTEIQDVSESAVI